MSHSQQKSLSYSQKLVIGLVLGMIVLTAAPLISAYYLSKQQWQPNHTNNHGQWLQHSAPPMSLSTPSGASQSLDDYRGYWLMLTFTPTHCSSVCEQKLFALRQSARAQGIMLNRIKPLWLMVGEQWAPEKIRQVVKPIIPLKSAPLRQFAGMALDHLESSGIFLIDPQGVPVMYYEHYQSNQDIRGMIRDIRKLVKY